MNVMVRIKGENGLACFVVDTKDHAEAIATVKESVGARAASPVLAVISGSPPNGTSKG